MFIFFLSFPEKRSSGGKLYLMLNSNRIGQLWAINPLPQTNDGNSFAIVALGLFPGSWLGAWRFAAPCGLTIRPQLSSPALGSPSFRKLTPLAGHRRRLSINDFRPVLSLHGSQVLLSWYFHALHYLYLVL